MGDPIPGQVPDEVINPAKGAEKFTIPENSEQEVSTSSVEQQMVPENVKRQDKIKEIAELIDFDRYAGEIFDAGETPEAHILAYRRIIRECLEQTMINLEKTGRVKRKEDDYTYLLDRHYETSDPSLKPLIDSLQDLLPAFEGMYNGTSVMARKHKEVNDKLEW